MNGGGRLSKSMPWFVLWFRCSATADLSVTSCVISHLYSLIFHVIVRPVYPMYVFGNDSVAGK